MFRPATSLRTPSRTFFAECYLTPGPQEIGETGDNSYDTLYGSEWLFSIEDGTRILRAYQRLDGEWVERTDDARMPPIVGQAMDENVRRLSGTFDQSARVVVAYEDGEGVVRVTRWDASLNEYVQNVTFSGADPVVVMDASWRYLVPDSDVLLFYLSPDRTRVLCRVQRDVYAVEHEIWESGHWEGDPDPQTESQVTSTTTGSAYPSYYSEATIHEDGRLTHVRIDASTAGAWSLSVEPAGGGPALAGASASGGPGVIEFALTEPLPVSAATAYRFVFTPPTSAQVRYNTAAWSGALWSASTLFFVGFGVFNGSPPMGLTVDVGEAVFVPGGPVILDRVTPLAWRYQLLLAGASGEPLDHALVSSLYPLATRAELMVAGEFHVGAYDLVAHEYKPTVAAALAGEFTAGALTLPVVKVEPLISVSVAGAFAAGILADVVTKYQPQLDVRLTGEFISGELADIGTRVERNLALGLAGEFVGGAYEQA